MSNLPQHFLDFSNDSFPTLGSSFDFNFLDDSATLDLIQLLPEFRLTESQPKQQPSASSAFPFLDEQHIKKEFPVSVSPLFNMSFQPSPAALPEFMFESEYPLSPASLPLFDPIDHEDGVPRFSQAMNGIHPASTPRALIRTEVGSGPSRELKIHDGKMDHTLHFSLSTPVETVRFAILENRPPEYRSTVVILTARLNGKRLSDTGTYDEIHVFDRSNGATLAHFPNITDLYVYDICQGQPLRGENGVHARLCHPKSAICEAHRKQLERAKTKRPVKDRSVSPEIVTLTEEAKRRKRMEECSMNFEVLLGDACRLGQDLLSTITAYTPMRSQLRLISTHYQKQFGGLGSLSMRWPASWQTDRLLGFSLTDTVVKFYKAANSMKQEVAVRSSLEDNNSFDNKSNVCITLDARWDFDELLSIVLMTIQSPTPVNVNIKGVRKGELAQLCEYSVQAFPAPLLFVPRLEGQRTRYDVLLITLECLMTGRTLCQQIVKLTPSPTWSIDMASQWFTLVERKFHNQGTLEPASSWRAQIEKMLVSQLVFDSSALLSTNYAAMVPLGFSVHDIVCLADEMRLEVVHDTLVESTQYCVRASSRR